MMSNSAFADQMRNYCCQPNYVFRLWKRCFKIQHDSTVGQITCLYFRLTTVWRCQKNTLRRQCWNCEGLPSRFFDVVNMNSGNMGEKKAPGCRTTSPLQKHVFRCSTILVRHSFVVHHLPASESAQDIQQLQLPFVPILGSILTSIYFYSKMIAK